MTMFPAMDGVVVIDACGGNLSSLVHGLLRLGCEPRVTSDPEVVRQAKRVILPGVGTAQDSMARLRQSGLVDVIRHLPCPLLGICIGMQLLFDWSEEGSTETLGLIPGRVTRLVPKDGLRVPHMGWNPVHQERSSLLLTDIADGAPFYFVHSYRAPYGDFVSAFADHGDRIPAVVQRGHVYGVQCHPEKSQAVGAQLLRNFISL
jgi:glutamine amidotransferase